MKSSKGKAVLWVVLLLLAFVGAGSFFVYRFYFRGASQTASKIVYYCPMHPTYTSDRPGDCPICNMKLEKREEAGGQALEPKTQKAEDICYMHNCPMVHDGKPCPMLVVAKTGEKVTCPVCGTHVSEGEMSSTEKKILYWTDPMMPDFKSDKPGQSPMGMDLVPVYEEAGGVSGGEGASPLGYAPILVSPQKMQLIGVKTTPARKQKLTKTIRTVGRVTVDETRIVHVHPKVEGWVEEIFAKYEGDKVTKGQPIFSFYSPDFVTAQEEYLTALKMVKDLPQDASQDVRREAEVNVASSRQRLLWWDVADEQIKQLEQRGTPSKTLVLTSPMDGIVLAKHVFAGEFMERGGDFYHLADLSTLWVDADLYEYDLPWVKVGQEAFVTLPNDSQSRFLGKVIYVAPVLKPETRTAIARLELPNPDYVLKPEMYVTAQISVDFGESLVVPSEAVLDTGVRKILFVSKGEGIFEPRDVSVGAKGDDLVQIKDGLKEGEVVVTSGNFLIDSESRLKAAIEGMGPSTGSTSSPQTSSGQAGEHHHGQ